jgi:hypothetical protein
MGLAAGFFSATAGAGRFIVTFFLATLALAGFALAILFLAGLFLAGFFIFLGAFLAAFLPVAFFAFPLEPFVFFLAISTPLSQSHLPIF